MINAKSMRRILKIAQDMNLPIEDEIKNVIEKLENTSSIGCRNLQFSDFEFKKNNETWNIDGQRIKNFKSNGRSIFLITLSSGRLSSTTYMLDSKKTRYGSAHGKYKKKDVVAFYWIRTKLF